MLARHDPDPDNNPSLANAIERAKAVNMPKENIERAIKRATGDLEGVQYEEISYEGYGPGGVAMLVRVVTDNRNRSASGIRRIFKEFGGHMGEEGSVAWLFERQGVIVVDGDATEADHDELMMRAIELGAEDIQEIEDGIEIYCSPKLIQKIREALEAMGARIGRAESTMIPTTNVHLEGSEAERILKLMNRLDDHEDVQQVFANFDIPDEIFETVG